MPKVFLECCSFYRLFSMIVISSNFYCFNHRKIRLIITITFNLPDIRPTRIVWVTSMEWPARTIPLSMNYCTCYLHETIKHRWHGSARTVWLTSMEQQHRRHDLVRTVRVTSMERPTQTIWLIPNCMSYLHGTTSTDDITQHILYLLPSWNHQHRWYGWAWTVWVTSIERPSWTT